MYNNNVLIRNNTTFFLSVVRTPKSGTRSNEDSFLFKKYHLDKINLKIKVTVHKMPREQLRMLNWLVHLTKG